MKFFFLFLFFLLMLQQSAPVVFAQADQIEAGIDEKLGETIPLNLVFFDEKGDSVTLKQLIDKPTLMMIVYYNCPGLCSPLMAEVASMIDKVDLIAGKEFQLISISMDHRETSDIAAERKVNFMASMRTRIPDSAWRFLTGDSLSVKAITDALGFRFKKNGETFVHAGALMAVSPSGVITRYLMGTTFLPFDIKMAVLEASEGKVSPTVSKILQFCFSYDPQGKRYMLNITRIAGTITILAAIVFAVVLVRKSKKKIV